MVVLKYRNKSGWIKINYRKAYRFFGERRYFVTGCTHGKRTYMSYSSLESAVSIFNILKKTMELKNRNEE